MAVPIWIWFAFIFTFGCCIGSFLNVVIYRLPRDKSIVTPPSACPSCGSGIRFYDNIPLFSWLLLGGRCRHCKAPISPRYFIIELLTGFMFAGLFYAYFYTNLRPGLVPFMQGGWFIYLLHLILLAAFVAASAIDLELWIIPLSICWFVTVVGLAFSAAGAYIINPANISQNYLLPAADASAAILALGAAIGLAISYCLLITGVIKRSYQSQSQQTSEMQGEPQDDGKFNHRIEMLREIIFLLPVIICSLAAYKISNISPDFHNWWVNFSQKPVIAGFMGSLWGYFIGCGIVWGARIFGTLAFGKEAMGLGDVHLMGAAGAVIGPLFVVVAFFIAPFFGLAWAAIQMIFKKIRQIPYGPFLSLGVLIVMILHDRIFSYWILMFNR